MDSIETRVDVKTMDKIETIENLDEKVVNDLDRSGKFKFVSDLNGTLLFEYEKTSKALVLTLRGGRFAFLNFLRPKIKYDAHFSEKYAQEIKPILGYSPQN